MWDYVKAHDYKNETLEGNIDEFIHEILDDMLEKECHIGSIYRKIRGLL